MSTDTPYQTGKLSQLSQSLQETCDSLQNPILSIRKLSSISQAVLQGLLTNSDSLQNLNDSLQILASCQMMKSPPSCHVILSITNQFEVINSFSFLFKMADNEEVLLCICTFSAHMCHIRGL